MKPIVLYYEKCSTCRQALSWLREINCDAELRSIKDDNPTAEELREWHKKSEMPLKRFFNTSGNLYKQLKLKDKLPRMSEEEQYQLLSTDGMLVKRPILVTDYGVCPGFRPVEWEELL